MDLLQGHLLLTCKVQAVPVPVELVHTAEEIRVHEDIVIVLGEHRDDLLHNLLHRRCSIRFGKVEKHPGDPVEDLSRELVCRDCILKVWHTAAGDDGIYLPFLLTYAELHGLDIVRLLY